MLEESSRASRKCFRFPVTGVSSDISLIWTWVSWVGRLDGSCAGTSAFGFDADPVVDGRANALFAAEVPLGRLNRDVPEEETESAPVRHPQNGTAEHMSSCNAACGIMQRILTLAAADKEAS